MHKSQHGQTYLFTGDTIFLKNDSWGTLVSKENKPLLREGLRLLRSLKPSVVISSASVGRFSFKEVVPDEWEAIVDGAIQRLRGNRGQTVAVQRTAQKTAPPLTLVVG